MRLLFRKHPCRTFTNKREGTEHKGMSNRRGVIIKAGMDNKYNYINNNIKNGNERLNDFPAATFNLLLEPDRASS